MGRCVSDQLENIGTLQRVAAGQDEDRRFQCCHFIDEPFGFGSTQFQGTADGLCAGATMYTRSNTTISWPDLCTQRWKSWDSGTSQWEAWNPRASMRSEKLLSILFQYTSNTSVSRTIWFFLLQSGCCLLLIKPPLQTKWPLEEINATGLVGCDSSRGHCLSVFGRLAGLAFTCAAAVTSCRSLICNLYCCGDSILWRGFVWSTQRKWPPRKSA